MPPESWLMKQAPKRVSCPLFALAAFGTVASLAGVVALAVHAIWSAV